MDKKIKVELLEELQNCKISCNHKTIYLEYDGRTIGIAEVDIINSKDIFMTKVSHILDKDIFDNFCNFYPFGRVIKQDSGVIEEFSLLGIQLIKKIGG